MKILLKNAKILTLKDENIIRGEILVKDNKIAQIAQKTNAKADKVIDCQGNLLMPGFKNAHTHSAMTFLRSNADDMPLHKWLNEYIFPLEKNFKKGDIYHLSQLAFLEYLTSGVTANFDMYFNIDEVKQASEDFGMRTQIAIMGNKPDLLKITKNRYLTWNKKNSLVNAKIAFHADYTANKEQLLQVSRLAHEFKAPVFTHCSETLAEVNNRKKISKMTPVEYLDSLKLFDYGGGIYHGVYLSDNDMKILKKRNVYVCTCPCSNLKLASGIAPIRDLVKHGVKVAIGTDGPASNNGLDMFREMYLVSTLSKYREKDAASLKAFDVLKMATVNGAHMMGLSDADILAKGKLADIIMIDLHQPDMQPINNIISNLVYSGNKLDVKMTMINGKILYYNHKFYVNKPAEKIYQMAAKISQRLIKTGQKNLKK